jgi:hypothetical protein
VPIVATVPSINASLPKSLNFGYCPAKESRFKVYNTFFYEISTYFIQTFIMTNTGELDFQYEWKLLPPFHITSPGIRGGIKYGQKSEFTVSFSPEVHY